MTSYSKDGKVGAWAQEKLDCLGGYLSAYTTILKNQDWIEGYYYIDAFAGAGRSEVRKLNSVSDAVDTFSLLPEEPDIQSKEEEAEYVEGSPYVALNIKYPFTKYYLIDLDPNRIERLQSLRSEFGDSRDIEILHNDANAAISQIVSDPAVSWKRSRAVAFLDPFGMQVNWNTIELLAQTKAIEVIINLPVGMAIQRFLERSGDVSKERREKLDTYFGDTGWYETVYEQQYDLLGSITKKRPESGHLIARWYQQRLKSAFGYSAPARLIRNSKKGQLYYLLWAGPNSTGAKIAQHVLKQGEAV